MQQTVLIQPPLISLIEFWWAPPEGNIPGLIVMSFIGHFLSPMKPSCHVNWMIPPPSVITESMTDGHKSAKCLRVQPLQKLLLMSSPFSLWCYSLRLTYRCPGSKDAAASQTKWKLLSYYQPKDRAWNFKMAGNNEKEGKQEAYAWNRSAQCFNKSLGEDARIWNSEENNQLICAFKSR